VSSFRGEGQIIGLDVEVVIRSLTPNSGAADSIASFGVIDTGADKVLIPRSIAKRLGLKPINNITAFLASGEGRPAINYLGVLELPALGYSQPIEMTAMADGGEPNHVLLGKNFLREFLVTIDCARSVCWFNRHGGASTTIMDDE